MRKFAVVGASALVLALGAVQASASPQRADMTGYFTQNPYWGAPTWVLGHTLPPAAADRADLTGFRAQAPDAVEAAPAYVNPPRLHGAR